MLTKAIPDPIAKAELLFHSARDVELLYFQQFNRADQTEILERNNAPANPNF